MKKLALSVVAIACFVSQFSMAVYDPSWERPIMRADLEQLGVPHSMIAGANLTMNRRDGAPKATSFKMEIEHRVMCLVAPCPVIKSKTSYQVYSSKVDGCGSIHYEASARLFQGHGQPVARQLKVVDHLHRFCEDYRPYKWEVFTKDSSGRRLSFGGNPTPVATIASVNR